MKATHKLFSIPLTLAALTAGVWAQTQVASNAAPVHEPAAATPAAAQPVVTAADIQELKNALAAQQQQIQALQQQLQSKEQALQQVQSAAEPPAKPGTVVAAVAPQPAPAAGISGVQQENAAGPATGQDAPQTYDKQMEGPLTLHFLSLIHI